MELALNQPVPLMKRLSWFDWLFAAIVAAGGLFALSRFGEFMDIYEKGILLAAIISGADGSSIRRIESANTPVALMTTRAETSYSREVSRSRTRTPLNKSWCFSNPVTGI